MTDIEKLMDWIVGCSFESSILRFFVGMLLSDIMGELSNSRNEIR